MSIGMININRALLTLYYEESYKYIAKDDYLQRLRKQLSALERLHTLSIGTVADTVRDVSNQMTKITERRYEKNFIIDRDVYERIINTTKSIIHKMSTVCTMVTTKDLIDPAIVETLNDSISSKYSILTTNALLSDIDHDKPVNYQGLQKFMQMVIDIHNKLTTALGDMVKKLSMYIDKQTNILNSYTNDVTTHSDYHNGLGNNLPNVVDRYKDSVRSIELLIKSTDVCIGNITVLTSAISKHWK